MSTTFLRVCTANPEATEAACQALAAIGLGGFGAHSCGPTVRTPEPQRAAEALAGVPGVHGCWSGTTNLLTVQTAWAIRWPDGTVEPTRLINEGAPPYLAAWARNRGGVWVSCTITRTQTAWELPS